MNDDWKPASCKAEMLYEWWVGKIHDLVNDDWEIAYCKAEMLIEW